MTATAAQDPHRLARAFLALADDTETVKRSVLTALAAVAAILTLAVAAPLTWMAPPRKVTDQPAATLANSKAAFHAADDEDDGGE